ncbi:hypothetical protein XENOCAPTIV_011243, partial [Xenoophorus captivus]
PHFKALWQNNRKLPEIAGSSLLFGNWMQLGETLLEFFFLFLFCNANYISRKVVEV